jgi:outer membrane protein OmpA-like peptidoglycan-associated protein
VCIVRTAFLSKAEARKRGRDSSDGLNSGKRSLQADMGAAAGMPIFLQRMKVYPALKIDPANAAYEEEADRVSAATQSEAGRSPSRPQLTTRSTGTIQEPSPAGSILRQNLNRSLGNGNPLPATTRETMEEKLGTDFGGVRVHSDPQAQQLSSALGANAFTTGKDIYFNQSRYDPESKAGQSLLAHELTHVAQQGGGDAGPIQCDMMESLTPTALGGFELGMAIRGAPQRPGMEGTIKFLPDPTGPYSTEIALIQTANLVDMSANTTPIAGSPVDWRHSGTGTEAPRNEVRTPLGGTFIDAIYADAPRSSAETPNYVQAADIASRPADNYNGWLRSPTDVREASLYDYPSSGFDRNFTFETVAKGTDNQVVYGSLDWGFQLRSGVVQNEYRNPHALESAEFDEALERFRGYYTHEPIVLYFDTDRDLPMAGELTKLSDVTSYMSRYPDVSLEVDGYADETGAADYNRRLSRQRAENTVTILTSMGVDASRISRTAGQGATTTFSAGSPAAAAGSLRANRRSVISFVRTAETPIAP